MAPNSYKAKMLALLAEKEAVPGVAASNAEKTLTTIRGIDSDVHLALGQIKRHTTEVASETKALLDMLESTNSVAGLEFGSTSHMIDSKIHALPAHMVLRRARDAIKIAVTRIGVLAEAATEFRNAYLTIDREVSSTAAQQKSLSRLLLETTFIGPNPTSSEREDYHDNKDGTYRRYDLEYEDLDEDWFTKQSETMKFSPGRDVLAGSETENDDDAESTTSTSDELQNLRALVTTGAKKLQAASTSKSSTLF